MSTWIVIRNWDRFQHYGDYRQPPWIKMYTALLHDDEFQNLSPTDRQALTSLWLLYAMTRRRVRVDTAKISRAIGQRVTKGTLERLNHAGFVDFSASTPLALEVEVEVEPPKSPTDVGDSAPKGRVVKSLPWAPAKSCDLHQSLLDEARQLAEAWDSGGSDIFDERLDELEARYHDRLRTLERDTLWEKAFQR